MPSLVPASMSTKIKGAAFWSRCTSSVARSSLLFKRFRFLSQTELELAYRGWVLR
jgi:hypothetical protein